MAARSGIMNNIVVILVRPQLGENIGAAARAMLNFGINQLRLVLPRTWPSESAEAMAVGAAAIVKNAVVYDSLQDAIADRHIVYAASARNRYLNKPVVSPSEVMIDSSKVALVFGPERSGLTNDDIALADSIISIPVNPEFTSINLAQSVAVIAYELFKNKQAQHDTQVPEAFQELATQQEIGGFFDSLENSLEQANFFKVDEKKPGMIRNIRSLFKRITPLTSQDIRTLHGIIRAITKP